MLMHLLPEKNKQPVLTLIVAISLMLLYPVADVNATSPGVNGRIVYNNYVGVASVLPNGTSFRQINKEWSYSDPYVVSKDGSKIAFSVLYSGPDLPDYSYGEHEDIDVMNIDGSGQKAIADSYDHDYSEPGWSPDGTKIAFVDLDHTGQVLQSISLKVINANGGNMVTLINNLQGPMVNSSVTAYPRFSPDGTKIVFSNKNDLCIVDENGSNLTQITHEPSSSKAYEPDWSPDGRKIVFTINGPDGSNVYSINTDGSNLTQLTSDGISDQPVWSPDGTKVAYHIDIVRYGDTSGVYIMSTNGISKVRILPSGNDSSWPVWTSIVDPDTDAIPKNTSIAPSQISQRSTTPAVSTRTAQKSNIVVSAQTRHSLCTPLLVIASILLVVLALIIILWRLSLLRKSLGILQAYIQKLQKLIQIPRRNK
jgi:hypothetical protein